MNEIKTRSILKTIIWRFIATLNSYLVLFYLNNSNKENLYKAIYMNITGFFIYYFYERIWNFIKWGKI
jgi:uncharacterized membrane protein